SNGKKWAMANPVSTHSNASTPSTGTDASTTKYKLESFLASGGIVLACGWAFRFAAAHYRKADKLDGPAALAAAKVDLIPGVILQPNGIFAALRAQEAGCSYIMAS
ncbi:MAG: hypothetical protein ABI910_12930, partial [Gemmatimonadota bacterium]